MNRLERRMAMQEPSETVVESWARLVRLSNQLLSAIERDLKRAGHPPLSWYDVLLELKRAGEGGLRPFELERKLLLAQHNVSRLLDRLADRGFVSRKPADDDGRGQYVVVTEEGRALLKAMWPDYAAAIQQHLGARFADEAEVEQLHALLGTLLTRSGA